MDKYKDVNAFLYLFSSIVYSLTHAQPIIMLRKTNKHTTLYSYTCLKYYFRITFGSELMCNKILQVWNSCREGERI